VAGSAKRERQLARERYLRQQERRAQARARSRRNQQVAAVVVAVVLVIGGVVGLTAFLGGDDDKTTTAGSKPSATASESGLPSASTSPSASTAPAASGCTYTKSTEPASKDVGLPAYDKSKAASYRKPFTATVKTNVGDIVIKMAADKAPCTTNSFRHLATKKYYDGTSCHRLTTENLFVLQCGDPTGTGGGGPGYQFGVENAPKDGKFPAGSIAMARTSDPNTNGSQFFIVYKDTQLPTDGGGYSIFGKVTKGLDVINAVAKAGVEGGASDGKPAQPVTIESVQIAG
jgi:peptidyl-prolyl cis-trans isomerase B (cyclophilin B)